MRQLSGGTFTRGFALAILGAGGVVGFVAFSSAPFAQTAQPTSAQPTPAQLSAAQTVAYRFPPNWHAAAATTPATTMPATARADSAAAAAPARAGAAPARPAAPAARELPRDGERQALASLMFNRARLTTSPRRRRPRCAAHALRARDRLRGSVRGRCRRVSCQRVSCQRVSCQRDPRHAGPGARAHRFGEAAGQAPPAPTWRSRSRPTKCSTTHRSPASSRALS